MDFVQKDNGYFFRINPDLPERDRQNLPVDPRTFLGRGRPADFRYPDRFVFQAVLLHQRIQLPQTSRERFRFIGPGIGMNIHNIEPLAGAIPQCGFNVFQRNVRGATVKHLQIRINLFDRLIGFLQKLCIMLRMNREFPTAPVTLIGEIVFVDYLPVRHILPVALHGLADKIRPLVQMFMIRLRFRRSLIQNRKKLHLVPFQNPDTLVDFCVVVCSVLFFGNPRPVEIRADHGDADPLLEPQIAPHLDPVVHKGDVIADSVRIRTLRNCRAGNCGKSKKRCRKKSSFHVHLRIRVRSPKVFGSTICPPIGWKYPSQPQRQKPLELLNRRENPNVFSFAMSSPITSQGIRHSYMVVGRSL